MIHAIQTIDEPFDGVESLAYRRHIRRWREGVPFRGVLAEADGTTLGLALLAPPFTHDGRTRVRLCSIAVAPNVRRQGIGTALLHASEAAARAMGSDELYTIMRETVGSFSIVRAMLARAGWCPPELIEYHTCIRVADRERVRQVWNLDSADRRGFGASRWSELSDRDRADVQAIVGAADFDPHWSPEINEAKSDARFSFAMRADGRVVGWVFGSVQDNGIDVGYFNGWVREPYQSLGWLPAVVPTILDAQRDIFGEQSLLRWQSSVDRPRAARFVLRRLRQIGAPVEGTYRISIAFQEEMD